MLWMENMEKFELYGMYGSDSGWARAWPGGSLDLVHAQTTPLTRIYGLWYYMYMY